MSNSQSTPTDPAALRRRAEQRVREKYEYRNIISGEDVTPRLLHELQVHQIELEMQNEELRQARAETEDALQRYIELYDFAPIGYFTLWGNGIIGKANFAAARMLGIERAKLVGRQLGSFVAAKSLPAFNTFMENISGEQAKASCEVELFDVGGAPVFVLIEAAVDRAGNERRMAVMDITQRREAGLATEDLLRQNRALAQRMFTMQEESMRKIARELHDELGQWLTAIQAEAQVIDSVTDSAPAIHVSAQAISKSAGAMHEVIRRMVHSLRPSLLDALGLAEALRELEKQWRQPRLDIACDFALAGDLENLSDDLKITLFRLVQEALNNIASYAQANQVSVQLRRVAGEAADADFILLSIADDGVGFDPSLPIEGTGLLGMRERAIAAGGEFDLVSAPGQGVRINIKLPIQHPEEKRIQRKQP